MQNAATTFFGLMAILVSFNILAADAACPEYALDYPGIAVHNYDNIASWQDCGEYRYCPET